MSASRYDRTIRVVMWLDAFLSAALAVLCCLASPIIAMVGIWHRLLEPLAVAAVLTAALLAGLGAVTAVLLMLRMRAGNYLLPDALRLPLPSGMRPTTR